jgi:hypothetical protein
MNRPFDPATEARVRELSCRLVDDMQLADVGGRVAMLATERLWIAAVQVFVAPAERGEALKRLNDMAIRTWGRA